MDRKEIKLGEGGKDPATQGFTVSQSLSIRE